MKIKTMNPRTYFKPQTYMYRLNKYSVNSYYLDFLVKKGNLRETLIKARVISSREVISEILSDPEAWNPETTEEEKEKNIEDTINRVDKKEAEEVDKFFVTQLNQTLVMLCTVFDTFLVDCFDVITYVKPEIIKSFTAEKDISVAEVIDAKTYDNVFNTIQGKVLERFDYSGIEKKFEYLKKAGLETKDLFILNNIMAPKYSDPLRVILKAYKDRNDIVHRNQMKIYSYQEIEYIANLMNHLIMNWGITKFKNKFKIDSDFILRYQGKLLSIID